MASVVHDGALRHDEAYLDIVDILHKAEVVKSDGNLRLGTTIVVQARTIVIPLNITVWQPDDKLLWDARLRLERIRRDLELTVGVVEHEARTILLVLLDHKLITLKVARQRCLALTRRSNNEHGLLSGESSLHTLVGLCEQFLEVNLWLRWLHM